MDEILCDEILQEIFLRLPTAAAAAASLVSRRWRFLLLSSLTALTLHLPHRAQIPVTLLSSLTSLSSLTILPLSHHHHRPPSPATLVADLPRSLLHLRLLLGPLPPSALLSPPFRNLISLQLSSLRPFSLRWLQSFPHLLHLSILDCSHAAEQEDPPEIPPVRLQSLSLAGIPAGDSGFAWLWRRCTNLRTLKLRGCEGTGDDGTAFADCLRRIRHLELRTCRTIADGILRRAANLETLVLYDGGSREGLRGFVARSGPSLRMLDLRLPLDLDDSHLEAVAMRGGGICSLRLQSCCLVTGEGLRRLAESAALGGALEELSLVNCDVVDRETGVLTYVGQRLRRLRRVDLSYNEGLRDRELGGMAAACGGRVVELRVRGCRGLSAGGMEVVARWCEAVEEVDLRGCVGVGREAVEAVVRRCNRLRTIWVEEWKLSPSCRDLAHARGIRVC